MIEEGKVTLELVYEVVEERTAKLKESINKLILRRS
ncbi:hypothetical protein BCF55_1550 [Hydrogenivirga caldilitoris]|uniref:Uncharacterized protein n=1 Tax=Hydrogenivirga caldilitoris TaxID=246264 RepID=A0A497XSL6_9AQUI|nr:hypothetical protein BCF55_1550 [Hydrogenivirga caldilitoris]